MKRLRHSITIFCIVATFIASAGEAPAVKAKDAVNQPTAVELQPLQGAWEGFMVGAEADGKITITITGSSLHFRRDTNFWFETTFTLPSGTEPKQLRATIKNCADKSSIGEVVPALYNVEEGTLTLVPIGGGNDGTPKSIEDAKDKGLTRYELQKVQPQKKNTQPPKTK